MEYEIYFEYYNFRENKIIQQVVGKSKGKDFKDACCNYADKNAEFAKGFNSERLTYKNHKLHENLMQFK